MMKELTLKDLREQNKKTVAEVATALNVTTTSIYRYEKNHRQIDLMQVLLLAKLYDCTAEEIIEAQLNSCP